MNLPLIMKKKIKALIVGGGKVGLRKAKRLLQAGAETYLETPEISPELYELSTRFPDLLNIIQRKYQTRTLEDFDLIFACTNDTTTNHQIYSDAKKSGTPVNVADNPQECDFILPATFTENNLTTSFSCEELPVMASALRDWFVTNLPQNAVNTINELNSIRKKLKRSIPNPTKRSEILHRICTIETLRHCSDFSSEETSQYLQSLIISPDN